VILGLNFLILAAKRAVAFFTLLLDEVAVRHRVAAGVELAFYLAHFENGILKIVKGREGRCEETRFGS